MEKTEHLIQLVKDTIEQIVTVVRHGRKQNYYQFVIGEQQILEQIGEILSLCEHLGLHDNLHKIQNALVQIMSAKEMQDYILVTDYYELLLLPVLKEFIEFGRQYQNEKSYWKLNKEVLKKNYYEIYKILSQIDIKTLTSDEKYHLEDTMSGEKTLLLKGKRKNVYFHSNNNPKEEAVQLAEAYYEKCNTVYHVLGLGLGYLLEAFLKLDTSSRFVVYESDINIIRLLCECRDCRALLENRRIELIYDKDYSLFLSHLQEGHTVFHAPSLQNIEDEELFLRIYDYYMTIQSAVNQRQRMQENFTCNLIYKDESVEVLRDELEGKTVYLIGGGPSLDKTMESLKRKLPEEKIVCVGTSVKKLKAAGITPDYMVVTDPMPWMCEQVAESKEVPLWYLSTAFYEVRNAVKQGYLILQQGYEPAEEYGMQKGRRLYSTGGSVATTALDILLDMGCKEVICMGLDMAYTDNKSHADGTTMARRMKQDNKALISVKGVLGNILYAPKNLNLYRRWIENRVKKVENIVLINVSDGAYINGMKNIATSVWNQK